MKRIEHCVRMLAVSGICLLAGCAREVLPAPVEVSQESGVTEKVWEAPIVDTITVPAGLDPEGNYYRPAHKEVVEVRQGRWETK